MLPADAGSSYSRKKFPVPRLGQALRNYRKRRSINSCNGPSTKTTANLTIGDVDALAAWSS
jgi:hypothetical protein